jgi:hypothetical protein
LQAAQLREQRFERQRLDLVAGLPFDNARKIPGFPLPRACVPSATVATLDPDRSLFVHDVATLKGADFLPTGIKGPADSLKLHQQDAKLLNDAQREAQAAGLRVPQPAPEARPSLGVTQGLSDRGQRSKARIKAVRKLLENTPPRRTVTGSFRVH